MCHPGRVAPRWLCLAGLGFFFLAGVRDARSDQPSPPAAQTMPTPEEAERWLEENLPRWRVFLGGDCHGSTEPDVIDQECPLIALRVDWYGQDWPVRTWVPFSATWLRDDGSKYTRALVEKAGLSMLDVLVIRSILERGDVPVKVLDDAVRKDLRHLLPVGDLSFDAEGVGVAVERLEAMEYPDVPDAEIPSVPGVSPPTGWVCQPDPNLHQHTPDSGCWWPTPSSPPMYPTNPFVAPPPPGWKPKDYRNGPRRSPNGDPGGYSTRDRDNGLQPNDDPKANPADGAMGKMYPGWDSTTRDPRTMEVFKCQGVVYTGYKDMCPDYALSAPARAVLALRQLSDILNMRHDPECVAGCMNMVLAAPVVLAVCAYVNGAATMPAPPNIMAFNAATAVLCDQLGLMQLAQVGVVQGGALYLGGLALLTNFCQTKYCCAPSGEAACP
jgi:hypothetical protein